MHNPPGPAVIISFYYRQRTIQNTKQSIKQQEQQILRQKCAQSGASNGNISRIRLCRLCVHITKACAHAANCALCNTENISITNV